MRKNIEQPIIKYFNKRQENLVKDCFNKCIIIYKEFVKKFGKGIKLPNILIITKNKFEIRSKNFENSYIFPNKQALSKKSKIFRILINTQQIKSQHFIDRYINETLLLLFLNHPKIENILNVPDWIYNGIRKYMIFSVRKKMKLPLFYKKKRLFSIFRKMALVLPGEKYNLVKKDIAKDLNLNKDEIQQVDDIIYGYFWYNVCKKCGDNIISKFLKHAEKLENFTDKKLIPLFSELTGINIRKELNVNLEQVLQFIENN
jgi:hypothetical protein